MIPPLVEYLQVAVERRMQSVVTITRPDGTYTTDPTTLEQSPGAATVAAGVPALIAPSDRSYRQITPGDEPATERRYDVDVPVGTTAQIDDLVTVTSSPNSDLVGQTFRVMDLPDTDTPAVRRLVCSDLRGA